MKLVKYPDPILLRKSEDVELTEEVFSFIKEMSRFYKTELKWGHPVGLAAPQVGKNWNIFIAIDTIYINPKIVWTPKGGWSTKSEGCFSLDENRYNYRVRRQDSLILEWLDLHGNKKTERFYGFPAQVIQHEHDHLQGILCCGEA